MAGKRFPFVLAILWGLVPLLLYLPVERAPVLVERLVLVTCLLGAVLAYLTAGGVHGAMQHFPWLCSLYTTLLALAVIFALRARAARRQKAAH